MPDSEGQTKRRKLNTQDEEISQNSVKDDWISGRSDARLNDDEVCPTVLFRSCMALTLLSGCVNQKT